MGEDPRLPTGHRPSVSLTRRHITVVVVVGLVVAAALTALVRAADAGGRSGWSSPASVQHRGRPAPELTSATTPTAASANGALPQPDEACRGGGCAGDEGSGRGIDGDRFPGPVR
jgi:hypothetical protein